MSSRIIANPDSAWLPRAARATLLAAAMALALLFGRGHAATTAQEPNEVFLDRVIASLTVDERVGQLVMVNFVGTETSPESDIAGLIRDFRVGAVLVTASNGNIVNRGDTPAQIAGLANGLQQRAFDASKRTDAGAEYFIPLLVATDNEGDLFPYTNVTNGFTPVPNNLTIGATWSKQHAEMTGSIVGRELSAVGINMLLGPVVDVLDNPRSGGDGDIGIRSFGGSAAWAGALGRAYVRGVHIGSDERMIVVAKHFPGHGGSDRATDAEAPTVNKSLDQLRRLELVPFAELARDDEGDAAGVASALMVSHIRYRQLQQGGAEPFTRPISLDAVAFAALMGLPEFAGWRADHLVMSDSLGVGAVRKWYAQQGQAEFPNRTIVRDALLAGSDLLPLVEFYAGTDPGWKNNQLPLIQDSVLYMREQYAADADFRRRVDDAVRHVIAAKLRLYPELQLSQVLVDAAAANEEAGNGEAEMTALAEDALTLIQPLTAEELRARLPRGPLAPEKVLIVECWADCYPYRIMTKSRLQEDLLRLYGPSGKGRLKPEDVRTISFAELDAWLAEPADEANASTATAVGDATWVIFALTEYNPTGRPASGAVKRFLDRTPVDLRNKNLVAIAYNVPYHLDSTEISKLAAYFAVYSKTQAAIDTSFRALFGDAVPRGHSPVDISGVFYDVGDATQPDPVQEFALTVYGADSSTIADAATVALIAGPIFDRNGNPVPDGTSVSFTLGKTAGSSASASAKTVDGLAGAQLAASGPGEYSASATAGGVPAKPLALTLETVGAPPAEPDSQPVVEDEGGGRSLAVIASLAGVVALAIVAGSALAVFYRRRAAAPTHVGLGIGGGEVALPAIGEPPFAESALRVDAGSRRVYVKGEEVRPPLSNEQFRLLSYLSERAGKVVGREELVLHVWPDAHSAGVSEEALDALVRRVRERIAQAGGERAYIVTLRGQGFRLEV